MRGFVMLVAADGQGSAWVRLRDITAVRLIEYRDGRDPAPQFLISALAGGEWWRDDRRHADRAAAEARVGELTGASALLDRIRVPVGELFGR